MNNVFNREKHERGRGGCRDKRTASKNSNLTGLVWRAVHISAEDRPQIEACATTGRDRHVDIVQTQSKIQKALKAENKWMIDNKYV